MLQVLQLEARVKVCVVDPRFARGQHIFAHATAVDCFVKQPNQGCDLRISAVDRSDHLIDVKDASHLAAAQRNVSHDLALFCVEGSDL